MIDVRMEIEALYVGSPPGAVNVPWYEYPNLTPDPHAFVRQVDAEAGGDKSRPIVLICRSGARTVLAGQALEAAGFTDVTNVLFGFEGDANDEFQRSTINGWRYEGLPWSQS
jgi:rhodanese-related sulfurtransferase